MTEQIDCAEDVFSTLSAFAKHMPGSIALASQAGQVSYADLLGHIASVTSTAMRKGIRPGQLVVIAVRNADVSLIIALALIRIGCRVGYHSDPDSYESKAVKVDAVIVDDSKAADAGRPVVAVTNDWFGGAQAQKLTLPPVSNAGSLIFSSSGSTGRPKLIERRASINYREINRRIDVIREFAHARVLPALGDRTDSHFGDSLAALLVGGTRIQSTNLRAETILNTIQLFRPDYVAIAPLILSLLVRTFDAKPVAMRKIGLLRTTGARCAPALQEAALDRFAEKYMSSYGAMEIGRIAAGYFDELPKIEGAAGRIVRGVEVAAFDENGHRMPVGMEGAIRARADGGHATYLGVDAEGQTAFTDGWFATGDIGFVDDAGNLILRGRASNVINVGGDKLNPEDMEEQLLSHASIFDAGVTGVDLAEGYQKIGAAIVSSAALDSNQINAYLRQKNKSWSIQELKIVSAIPKTQNGKIDRVALKRLLAE